MEAITQTFQCGPTSIENGESYLFRTGLETLPPGGNSITSTPFNSHCTANGNAKLLAFSFDQFGRMHLKAVAELNGNIEYDRMYNLLLVRLTSQIK